jgi:hypothetical protein
MKLAIADARDLAWDSWVFLEGASLTTQISISLGPDPGTSCQGTSHTLVAIIADNPRENVPVSFEIVAGPNSGPLGTTLTDADGIATLTYTSTGTTPAIDIAQASFIGSDGLTYFSEEVQVIWNVCETPTATATIPPTEPTSTPTATATVEPVNCTYTIGYWKENPEQWPVSSLTLGDIVYSQKELLTILNTPPLGDATYILTDQLIGAAFNVLHGADSSAIAPTLNEANAWLVVNPLGSNPTGTERQEGIDLARILSDYNRGLIGPGLCQQPPPTCLEPMMYGIHDESSADSQIFSLDMWFGLVSPLGPLHHDSDFESMDIHPETGDMYTIAGGDGDIDGQAYKVDKLTGELTFLGETGIVGSDEIVDMAFHPDGTLWIFQQDEGLFTLDITGDLSMTFVWDPDTADLGDNWEGLAWDRFGNELYGSEKRNLYRWNPVTQVGEQLCGKDFLPGSTEALDFRDDGALIGGWHNASDQLTVFEIDYDTCTISATDYNIEYNDIEALAFDVCIPQGSISGYVMDEIGQPLVGAEVRLVAAGANRFLESVADFAPQSSMDQDDVIMIQYTDANGRYQFMELPADLYAVVLSEDSLERGAKANRFPYRIQLAPGENYEQLGTPTAKKPQQGNIFATGSMTTSIIFLFLFGATARKRSSPAKL